MLAEGYFSPGEPPGFKQHCLTTNLIKNFQNEVEETHMKWLEDILIEAKKCFGSEDHHLLPKTKTDNKRKRGRKKQSSESTDGGTTSSQESPKAPAKRCKADTTVENPPSIETTNLGLPQGENNDPPTEVKSEDKKVTLLTRCEPDSTAVDEELPVRRSTRRRAPTSKMQGQEVTRSTRSTKRKTLQSESSEENSKNSRPSRKKKVKLEVKEEEPVTAADDHKLETANVMDPPPRNSPREEIESYYKDRVKRLINHHEKLMTQTASSGDDFTPPKRTRGVRAAAKKSRTSITSTARSTRNRKAKPVKADVRKDEDEVDEVRDTEKQNVDKAETDEKTEVAATIEDKPENKETIEAIRSDPNQDQAEKELDHKDENIAGESDEVDSKTSQEAITPKETVPTSKGIVHRIFGITSKLATEDCTPPKPLRVAKPAPVTPQAPGTSIRSTRSRIVKPIRGGGGKTKESQPDETEMVDEIPQKRQKVSRDRPKNDEEKSHREDTDKKEAETNLDEMEKRIEQQKSSKDKESDDEKSNVSHNKDSSSSSKSTSDEATSDEKESDGEKELENCKGEVANDEEGEDDDVIPPSPKTSSSEGHRSSVLLGTPASEVQRVLRRSSRQSTAIKHQRSSRSKKRSSTYHRVMSRQSRVSAAMVQQLGAAVSEEHRQGERRLTRSRTKKVPEEEPDTVVKENAALKRKSQESDDGACPGSGGTTAPVGSKNSPEEQKVTPENYDRLLKPHPKSFFNPSFSAAKKNSLHIYKNGQVASFIKRNTPLKKTQRDRKQEIVEKQRREEEVRRKLEDERKQRLDEMRQKREERARKVAEARERRLQIQSEKKRKLEERQEQKLALSNKQKEEKRKEELERRLKLTKKKVEAEERRRQEEEARLQKLKEQEELKKRQEDFIQRKKEYEEQERNRKLEESRRLAEQRRLETEKQRADAERKKQLQDEAHEREMQERKEEREREQKELERKRLAESEQREKEKREREALEAERLKAAQRALMEKQRQEEQRHLNELMKREKERLEAEKLKEKERAEQDRLKASILKHNTSINQQSTKTALNTTMTKESKTSPDSYEMTPQRIYVAASEENYGIEDINSGDSTDDEDNPRKVIPKWAQGAPLRDLCVRQYLHPPNLELLFAPIEPPDLEVLFAKKRARFFKRTSSAVWNSPPMAPGHRR